MSLRVSCEACVTQGTVGKETRQGKVDWGRVIDMSPFGGRFVWFRLPVRVCGALFSILRESVFVFVWCPP